MHFGRLLVNSLGGMKSEKYSNFAIWHRKSCNGVSPTTILLFIFGNPGMDFLDSYVEGCLLNLLVVLVVVLILLKWRDEY